jgi:hypothetical protein
MVDDIIDTLVRNRIVRMSEFSDVTRSKLEERKRLRAEMAKIQAELDSLNHGT